MCSNSIGKVMHDSAFFLKARGELTGRETKLLLYVISQIPGKSEVLPAIDIPCDVVRQLMGYEGDRNDWIMALKEDLKACAEQVASVVLPNGAVVLAPWFEYIKIAEAGESFLFSLNKCLAPLLIRLSSRFVCYELGYIFTFTTKYGARIYDVLKANAYRGDFCVEMNDLRAMLGLVVLNDKGEIVGYRQKTWNHFRDALLERALDEVNEKSDLTVSWKPVMEGKQHRVVAIDFHIGVKADPPMPFGSFEVFKDQGQTIQPSKQEPYALLAAKGAGSEEQLCLFS